MFERTTSTDAVVSGIAWAVVVLLYVVAGMFVLHDMPHRGILIAEVACGASAYAAVRHIRIYAVRICTKADAIALDRDVARLAGVPPQRVR